MGAGWSANSSFSACNCLPAKDKGGHPNEPTHEADAEQELAAPQQPIMTRVGSSEITGTGWSANLSFSACNCWPAKDKGGHPNEPTHEANAEQELAAPQPPIMTRVGSSGGFRQYSLEELSIATSGFSDEKKLGEGTYGTVYIASLDNEIIAAVKRFKNKDDKGNGFSQERKMGEFNLIHPNLIKMLGYSFEDETMAIVYEYVPFGTLEDRLHGANEPPLYWEDRMKICRDIAAGVDALHSHSPPVIHSDLKSVNILLDEHKKAMIADFGSWVSPETCDRTTAQGTIGMGVIILEVLTGMKAIDDSRPDKSLAAWASNVMKSGIDLTADVSLNGMFPPGQFKKAQMVALLCISKQADSRPDIRDMTNLFFSLVRAGSDRLIQHGLELKLRTAFDKMITTMAEEENQDAQAAQEFRERCLKLLAQD